MLDAAAPGVWRILVHDVRCGCRRALVQGHVLLLARLPQPPALVSSVFYCEQCAHVACARCAVHPPGRPHHPAVDTDVDTWQRCSVHPTSPHHELVVDGEADSRITAGPVLSHGHQSLALTHIDHQPQATAGQGVLPGDGLLPVRRRHAGVLGDAAQGLLGHDDAPLCHDHPHRPLVPPQVSGAGHPAILPHVEGGLQALRGSVQLSACREYGSPAADSGCCRHAASPGWAA
jgi:hypothetical protein